MTNRVVAGSRRPLNRDMRWGIIVDATKTKSPAAKQGSSKFGPSVVPTDPGYGQPHATGSAENDRN